MTMNREGDCKEPFEWDGITNLSMATRHSALQEWVVMRR